MSRAAIAGLAVAASLLLPAVALADTTSLTAAGSTALLPLLRASAVAYQSRRPDVKISVTGGGSRAGLAQVASGSVDMAMSDTPAAGYPDLVDHHVCVVAFAVLVNPGLGVNDLSKAQLRDIFAGKIANWKEVGGPDLQIVAINRTRGSGTRLVFSQTIMGAAPLAESAPVEDSTATLLADIRSTPGAISYAAFPGIEKWADDHFVTVEGVRALSIDGAAPSMDALAAGTYPLWSYEHVYTNGPPNREISRFLALVESDGEAVHGLGFLLVREVGRYLPK